MEPMVVMAVKAAATVGAEILKAHQNRHTLDLQPQAKGEFGVDGVVTRMDTYAEELLLNLLKKSYPKFSYLAEESGFQAGQDDDADWCWVVDPLDGTSNFIHGVPHFCISIAARYKGVTHHAVIYDPVRDEMFSASRGRGAVLNGRRLRVAEVEHNNLNHKFLAVGHPLTEIRNEKKVTHHTNHFLALQAVSEQGASTRRTGSASLDLAYVAAGRFDGYFEQGLKSWDVVAGELIVREAGGTVVDAKGGNDAVDTGQVIACPMALLKPLMQAVVPAWTANQG